MRASAAIRAAWSSPAMACPPETVVFRIRHLVVESGCRCFCTFATHLGQTLSPYGYVVHWLRLLQWTTYEVWGYRSQPVLACRFVNRVVTASDSVDTSRMGRQVLCACVGPQRTLDAPGEGAIFGPRARRRRRFRRAHRATVRYFEFEF